jgi:hypothetical protein
MNYIGENMQLKRENFCPLIKKECVGLKCAWFTKVEGYDINTGSRVDEWNCAITWFPMLLIENSGMQRQTGAAVESFRNEMVKANQASQELFKVAVGTAMQLGQEPKQLLIDGEQDDEPTVS